MKTTKIVLVMMIAVVMLTMSALPAVAYDHDAVEVDDSVYYATIYGEQRNLVRFANDTIMVVYSGVDGVDTVIEYATSTDEGVTWTEGGAITDDVDARYVTVAQDGEGRVWCAYVVTTGTNYINISYYDEGVWSAPALLNTSAGDQWDPFVCVNSDDDVYVFWDEQDTVEGGNFYQVHTVNFTFAQFPASIPVAINVNTSVSDQEYPTAAFDGNDTIHVAWEDTNTSYDLYYSYRDDGETDYEPAANITPTGMNISEPSMCVDEDGTVYVACVNFGSPYDIFVVYGAHPDGTDYINLTDELGVSTSTGDVSAGWVNGYMRILYSDIVNYHVQHIYGTISGWYIETDISVDGAGDTVHVSPSIRWAFYHEENYTVEYVFGEWGVLGPPPADGLFYQQIDKGSSALDMINSLIPLVISIMSLVLVVAVIKSVTVGLAKSFKK